MANGNRGSIVWDECITVCCSVLQCVAVCCSVRCVGMSGSIWFQKETRVLWYCVVVCCSVLQCVVVCCSVLQRVAVCCSVLQCVAVSGWGFSLWRTPQNKSQHIFSYMLGRYTARAITSFSPKIILKKIKKDRFWPFFWPWPMTVTWPPRVPRGVFQTACACDLRGGTFQVDLTSGYLSSDLKRGRGRGWLVNLTSATCQVPLVPKT